MESYMFQTFQRVPKRMIQAIGEDIKKNFLLRMVHHSEQELMRMGHDFDMAISQVSDEHCPSVDGYRLTDKQAAVIGDLLRMGKSIGAIKEFRAATGEDLRTAKNFIDKFFKGRTWEEAFLLWTNTFSAV
jgi:ribosomal protein L7/L12